MIRGSVDSPTHISDLSRRVALLDGPGCIICCRASQEIPLLLSPEQMFPPGGPGLSPACGGWVSLSALQPHSLSPRLSQISTFLGTGFISQPCDATPRTSAKKQTVVGVMAKNIS